MRWVEKVVDKEEQNLDAVILDLSRDLKNQRHLNPLELRD